MAARFVPAHREVVGINANWTLHMAYAYLWEGCRANDVSASHDHEFDAIRGVVYGVAIALVGVWLPIFYLLAHYT